MFARAAKVNTLLRMKLIDLPADVFTIRMGSPSAEGKDRLTKFHRWYNSAEAGRQLRVASLCLQLTTHAVSISSQKQSKQDGRLPMLVRLARGEVQDKTMEHLEKLLDNMFTSGEDASTPVTVVDGDLDVLLALENLLTTECHIIIRYREYAKYPFLIWKMSERWNPLGCPAECEELLNTNDSDLDAGYTLLLKYEALSKGDLSDALSFLLSATVQEEIDGIIEHAEATSLDAERAHYQVKRPEKGKVVSVATASRNNLLRKYLALRRSLLRSHLKTKKKFQKWKYMSWRALAIKMRPDLFKRPRGKLHWETKISEEQMKALVAPGDAAAADEFVREHKDELIKCSSNIRKEALSPSTVSLSSTFPILNKEWLTWLGDHDQAYRDHVKGSGLARAPLNHRLYVEDASLPPDPRLNPVASLPSSTEWQKKIQQCRQGWFCLVEHLGSPPVMSLGLPFYGVTLHGQTLAVLLQKIGENQFRLDLHSVADSVRPLDALLGQMELHMEGRISVDALEMTLVHALPHRIFILTVVGSTPVDLKPRAARASTAGDVSDGDGEDFVRGAESDACSLVSDREGAAELEVEEFHGASAEAEDMFPEETQEDEAAAEPSKAAHGAFVLDAESDGYFTLINNKKQSGIVMLLKPRWYKDLPEGMGSHSKSKTIDPRTYDEDKDNPHITVLLLHSWKLWRARSCHFSASSPARTSWYNDQVSTLARRLHALGVPGGGTGHCHADRMMREWTPEVFAG